MGLELSAELRPRVPEIAQRVLAEVQKTPPGR
jgi:hypothetical protein